MAQPPRARSGNSGCSETARRHRRLGKQSKRRGEGEEKNAVILVSPAGLHGWLASHVLLRFR